MHKKNFSENIFQAFNYIIFTIFAFMCIYPFYYMLICSLSSSAGGAVSYIIPNGFTLDNYKTIFNQPYLLNSVFVSLARAVLGTFITLFMCTMFAYVLTKKELRFRKTIYRVAVSSMYLIAGVVPYYLTMKTLGLKDNFLLYILPGAVQAYYVVLIKTYIEQIDAALEESAIVDGANFFTIFVKIIIPVCKPIIAAVAVFSAVGQWNSWYDNFLLVNNPRLQTMQLTTYNLLNEAEAIMQKAMRGEDINTLNFNNISPTSIRMSISIITIIPVIMFYPFLQKYFVKGIMLGAVKG